MIGWKFSPLTLLLSEACEKALRKIWRKIWVKQKIMFYYISAASSIPELKFTNNHAYQTILDFIRLQLCLFEKFNSKLLCPTQLRLGFWKVVSKLALVIDSFSQNSHVKTFNWAVKYLSSAKYLTILISESRPGKIDTERTVHRIKPIYNGLVTILKIRFMIKQPISLVMWLK